MTTHDIDRLIDKIESSAAMDIAGRSKYIHDLRAAIESDRKRRGEDQEPFGYFRAEPFGWTDCAETDEGAIALYERPQARGEPVAWQPIETAPKDNKRLLYLVRLDSDGNIAQLDFDGAWCSESESWETPEVYYFWGSANGIDDPTHWAYQDDPLPTAPQPAEPSGSPTLHNVDSGSQNKTHAP